MFSIESWFIPTEEQMEWAKSFTDNNKVVIKKEKDYANDKTRYKIDDYTITVGTFFDITFCVGSETFVEDEVEKLPERVKAAFYEIAGYRAYWFYNGAIEYLGRFLD